MKEIIEKTFEKVTDEFAKRGVDVFSQDTYLILNKYKNVLLKEIDEQEEKEFNPIECGFNYNNNGYFVKNNKNIINEITHLEDKIYRIYCYEFVHGQYNFPEKEDIFYIDKIKISNHNFGIGLLRNLGVIE